MLFLCCRVHTRSCERSQPQARSRQGFPVYWQLHLLMERNFFVIKHVKRLLEYVVSWGKDFFRRPEREKFRLEIQQGELKELAEDWAALETKASLYFKLPPAVLPLKASADELDSDVQKLDDGFRRIVPYDWMKEDMTSKVVILKSAFRLKGNGQTSSDLSPQAAMAIFSDHLATLKKIIKLAEEQTYDDIARRALKLPRRHSLPVRLTALAVCAVAIFCVAGAFHAHLTESKKDSAKGSQGNGSSGEDNIENPELPALTVLIFPQSFTLGVAESKPDGDKMKDVAHQALIVVGILAFLATLWAIQSYWRLVIMDQRDKRWRPPQGDSNWSAPYAFHSLAQSHKEWAQLWFSWCVAIFLGGVTYAIYNSLHELPKPNGTWPEMLLPMLNSYLHHSLVYALFGFAWYWAAKHYRSHWHNYVANAYRHRSLYRFELLRSEIPRRMMGAPAEYEKEANKTILELFRLSGILLLIPGESSYLDKPAGEEVSKAILQMEEVANAFAHRGEGGGKH
jgi:hypothetical protein